MASSDAPSAALADRGAERGSDEFAEPADEDAEEPEDTGGEPSERQWFGRFPAYPRNTPENLHTPDLTTRFYVGLWLPGAGALLAYAVMRGNYWAAFVGIELLLVGWFTLAKL